MRPAAVEALYACFEEIEAGASPDEALALYPELQHELEPLLRAALAVRALPAQPVRPSFRRRARRALAELEELEEERLAAAAPWWTRLFRLARTAGPQRPALPARAIAALLAFALVLGGILIPALANSTPGEALYPLRQVLGQLWAAWGHDDLLGGTASATSVGGSARGESPAARRQEGAPTIGRRRYGPVKTIVPTLPARISRASTVAPAAANRDTWVATVAPAAGPSTTLGSQAAPVSDTRTPAGRDEPGPTSLAPTAEPPRPSSPPVPTAAVSPTPTPGTPSGTPSPSPTSTPGTPSPPLPPTETPRPGSVTISGGVKHDDGTPGGRPLAGVAVSLFRMSDVACGGPEPVVGQPLQQTATESDGGYTFVAAPGEYLVAAADGPECLPRLWYVGPSDPGTGNPCRALSLTLLADGMSFAFANILYEASPGCPPATPLP